MKKITKEEIVNYRNKLSEEIHELEKLLVDTPEGKLICAKDRNSFKWYLSHRGKTTYLSKRKNKTLAKMLAEKRYTELKIKNLKQEQLAVDFYLRHCPDSIDSADMLLAPNSGYRELLKDRHFSVSDRQLEWQREAFNSNPLYSEACKFAGISGNMLRSKSEMLIDAALYSHGICFRYECELSINGVKYYPDFMIFRPSDGKIVYWEHLGALDNPAYSKKSFEKMYNYSTAGIVLGVNLIVTVETENEPLKMADVEHDIRRFILQ